MPILFGVLLLATAGAFAHSQRLKTKPLILDKVRMGLGQPDSAFTPNGDCQNDTIASRFRLTKPDVITVSIVGREDEHIRTLHQNRPLRAYKFFRFWWDGLDDDGKVVSTGPYRVRVELAEHQRDLLLPGRLRVHRSAYRPGPNCKKPRRYPRKSGASEATR